MRKFAPLIAVLLFISLAGCPKKSATSTPQPLEPTAREREVLRAYGLRADTPAGQKRLLKLRTANEKLAASRERMRSWAEAKAQRDRAAAQQGQDQAARDADLYERLERNVGIYTFEE